LSDSGKKIRLRRVLGHPGRGALVVAFDHALVLGPIPGTEDPVGKIRHFAQAGVDAVLLNLGLLRQFAQSHLDVGLPAFIGRIDWTTVWAVLQSGGGELQSRLLARPEEALRHGADAVITYMVMGTGDAGFEAKEIARTADVARECERVGIPLLVESLARGKQVDDPNDPKWLKLHTRMAVELGADAIKTDYSGNSESMRTVTEACPIPILVLGGSRQGSDEDALAVVRGAVQAGAAGVFFGRNVFQSPDMDSFLRRARGILDTPAPAPAS
jgi:DhnA family fructose-bisphosphate aldolase class Ia